jgi:hypothetical protein
VSSTSNPGTGIEPDGLQPDVAGERDAADGDQHLVGLHLYAVIEHQDDRTGLGRAAQGHDRRVVAYVDPGLFEGCTDHLTGERLEPRQ